ncbi:MAG: 30S ribosomal protein S1 [Spirochaetaceae bacterium]|jgi:small subunit ribosomal protein S1|nr:30S ribosomal protein S1 [Spirochaetaceae bacterium]
MVIAIDGPAGSGKSTIANMLAEKLPPASPPWFYLNSGSLYRAITLLCLREGTDPLNPEAALEVAKAAPLNYRNGAVYIIEENVESLLHTDEVDKYVSYLSSNVPIRHVVNAHVRRIARGQNIIVEGRDMTTVVFPDAEFRFYLDASIDERAKRRFEQGTSRLSLEEIKAGIAARDENDKHKEEGSLILGPGVKKIDTTPLTLLQVFDKLYIMITNPNHEGEETMVEQDVAVETTDTGKLEDGLSGVNTETNVNPSGEQSQTAMLEEHLKSMEQLEEGKLIIGDVVQIVGDQVFIDVGYKSEGRVSLSEFDEPPKIGDKVQVVLVNKENRYGGIEISKQKADAKIVWKNLREAHQDHLPVEGKITAEIKGGFEVNLGGGNKAFLPISQADVVHVDRPEKMIGHKYRFYIERLYSDGKVNIVVNRRKLLEEESESKRNEFLETVEIGAELDGVVKSFQSFGAFVDLGGFDGLLHIHDMSWGHVNRPKDFVKKGQKIKVKVIRIDPVEKKINLSLKHFSDDPWVHFEEKYAVNDIVKGRVTKLADFGAFIELEEGIEGLAHISEFSWLKKIQKPSDLLSIGDEVECMILGYDLPKGRVSLGLKQVKANPWLNIEEKYPVGSRITRKVVKLTNAGAFIELEDGIDGFLSVDDISWTRKVKRPSSELQNGQEVDVIVLAVEPEKRNIRLGIKQLEDDPWKAFAETYKPGSFVEGEISNVTDFGVFLKVPGGIEGLIHKSGLAENREDDPDELLKQYKDKIGEKLKAVVVEVDPRHQKAAFSIRDYKKKVEKEEISRYMASGDSDGDAPYTLGDMLKSKSGE